jgi:hypothetical protein
MPSRAARPCQSAQLLPQRRGCGHDQCAQLAERRPPRVERALACAQKRLQRRPSATRTRLRQLVLAEQDAGGADGVEHVRLAALRVRSCLAPDLVHALAVLGEVTGKPGPVAARALDRERAGAARVRPGEGEQAAIAARAGEGSTRTRPPLPAATTATAWTSRCVSTPIT